MLGTTPYVDSTLTGIQAVSLGLDSAGDPVDPRAAQMLPANVCRHFRMLPFSYDRETLILAMANPSDAMAQTVAYALTSDPLEVVLAPANQIDDAIDRAFGAVAVPGRIGEILVSRKLITEEDLAEALKLQRKTQKRVGEILYDQGKVREGDLASALADQLQVPLVDLDGIDPTPEALAMVPEELQREGRCVPLDADDEVLYVAITDPLDEETNEAIRKLTDLRIRSYMVTRSDLDGLFRRTHLEGNVRGAPSELLEHLPDDRVSRVLSGGQRIFFTGLVLAILIGLLVAPLATGIVLVIGCVLAYMLASNYKFILLLRAEDDATIDAIMEADLPPYFQLLVSRRRGSTSGPSAEQA